MWIALLILLLILTSILIYVLFAPVVLEIDTINHIYRLRFLWFAQARFFLKGLDPWFEVKIAWWQKEYKLLVFPTNKRETAKREESKEKSKRKMEWDVPWRKLIALGRSFKVERFSLRIDTGDFVLNAQLYPLLLNYGYARGYDTAINFTGENYLVLTIKNSAWRVLKAIIKNNK